MKDQRMLTDDTCVRITAKVCLLLSIICQDFINSSVPDNVGNRSFAKNYLPCQYRVFNIGCGGAVPGAYDADVITATILDT